MTVDRNAELRDRLHAIAAFLPAMEAPGFQFGAWDQPREFPGLYLLSEVAESLDATVYERWVLRDFDWMAWGGTEEAKALREEPARLAKATPHQLAQLLTLVFRQDHFCEGSLAADYQSGLLIRILRRAAALEAELI